MDTLHHLWEYNSKQDKRRYRTEEFPLLFPKMQTGKFDRGKEFTDNRYQEIEYKMSKLRNKNRRIYGYFE